MARETIFTLSDLRRGINDSDSPTLIPETQVVNARNVDMRDGALGSKRRGVLGIDLTGSAFDSPVVSIFRHTPTNSVVNDELWAIDENGNIDRRVGGTWAGGVSKVNNHISIRQLNYDANAVSLHGKLFIAARGLEDRLLVWDGTVLRWAGLVQPPDPTVANTGAGTFTGTRYYRIRYVERDAADTVTKRRSEPSNAVSLAPSGTGSGALITKPSGTEDATSTYKNGQTHWEVEASVDNILFYRIARVAIGTATYTDSTAFATGYSSLPLSEQVGEYIVPKSARHVAVDEDRLLTGGSHFFPALDSRVSWTPVYADDGVGNDERIPETTKNYISFDGLDGGGITSLTGGVAGQVYVTKLSRLYKMVRTGQLTSAYDPTTESFTRGATMRGAAAGTDEWGVPCLYFVDPVVGLCGHGQRGLQYLGKDIRRTWGSRNVNAAIGPRMLYYPSLNQVWYTLPVANPSAITSADGSFLTSADGSIVYSAQTSPGLLVEYEVWYGGNWYHDGQPGQAQAFGLFSTDEGMKPVIGTQPIALAGGGTSSLHYADTGVSDNGQPYRAFVVTKPYTLGGLWQKFGMMAGVLLARASAGASLFIQMLRNFSVETRQATVSLAPVGSETHVVKPIDNATMSELNTLQIEYGDESANTQAWSIDQLTFKIREEEGSAG